MARSSYIYVVRTLDRELVTAFTVRHELATWLRCSENEADLPLLRIDRVRDGRDFSILTMGTAEEFLKSLDG